MVLYADDFSNDYFKIRTTAVESIHVAYLEKDYQKKYNVAAVFIDQPSSIDLIAQTKEYKLKSIRLPKSPEILKHLRRFINSEAIEMAVEFGKKNNQPYHNIYMDELKKEHIHHDKNAVSRAIIHIFLNVVSEIARNGHGGAANFIIMNPSTYHFLFKYIQNVSELLSSTSKNMVTILGEVPVFLEECIAEDIILVGRLGDSEYVTSEGGINIVFQTVDSISKQISINQNEFEAQVKYSIVDIGDECVNKYIVMKLDRGLAHNRKRKLQKLFRQ